MNGSPIVHRDLRAAVLAVLLATLALGVAYPLALTAVGRLAVPGRAEGSTLRADGRIVGSRLIGQRQPRDARFFRERPSATGNDPSATAFSNLGPTSADLAGRLRAAAVAYVRRERPTSPGLTVATVPVDAVTTSASGVDPHISVRNATIQARRVAAARRLPLATVTRLVRAHTDHAFLGFAGEDGVDVLELNLALEAR